jgi:methylmalonyl-CoA/ethylmalonyl-CoA epimerase
MKRIDHVGVVAPSWPAAEDLLAGTFGLLLDESCADLPDGMEYEGDGSRIYFLKVGDGETLIEVLIPRPDTGTGRFLARRGPGLHHIAYACDDVPAETERLRAQGLEPIAIGDMLNGVFFRPKDTMGILTELVTLDPRAQKTGDHAGGG